MKDYMSGKYADTFTEEQEEKTFNMLLLKGSVSTLFYFYFYIFILDYWTSRAQSKVIQ